MAGLSGVGSGLGKKIGKIDPLRGGDAIWEKAGMPSFTGQGDKNIFGAQPEAPKTPEAAKATPMPDEDNIKSARKRSLARQQRTQGRSSTILSDSSDRLGG
jgi:hypothetical protein